MKERRGLPPSYVATLVALLALAVVAALVSLGVPPFDSLAVFVLSQVAAAFTLLLFGVLGGAFVGMLMAHRMLASREFTPFERATMEALEDIRARLERLERAVEPAEADAARPR